MAERSAISRFLNRPTAAYQTLIISTIALTVIGIVMVFSSSSIHSLQTKGNSFAIAGRQLFFLMGAAPLAYVMAHQKLATWKVLARLGFVIALTMELILQIPGLGKTVNGNRNWINLGPIDIQPSEFAKFFIILWAAHMLAKKEASGNNFANVVKLLTPAFGVIVVLILAGKDLGTAAVVAAIFAGLLWVSGVSGRIFGGILTLVFAGIAVLIATASYRAARLLVVLNPFDPEQYKNAGWQPAHSLLGLASGGFFGVGLGASRQKWGNLAEAHTDFIFSVIGEELGLFGTLAVLLLFAALIYSIFKISLRAVDPMVRYACAGIGIWITVQVILNIGSATSILPVVGVTLPFISYGGSSLVALFLGIGFVLGAARRDPAVAEELRKKKK